MEYKGFARECEAEKGLCFIEGVDVALLQESHMDNNEHLKLKHSWADQVYFSSFTTSSWVVTLIYRNLPFQLETCVKICDY